MPTFLYFAYYIYIPIQNKYFIIIIKYYLWHCSNNDNPWCICKSWAEAEFIPSNFSNIWSSSFQMYRNFLQLNTRIASVSVLRNKKYTLLLFLLMQIMLLDTLIYHSQNVNSNKLRERAGRTDRWMDGRLLLTTAELL